MARLMLGGIALESPYEVEELAYDNGMAEDEGYVAMLLEVKNPPKGHERWVIVRFCVDGRKVYGATERGVHLWEFATCQEASEAWHEFYLSQGYPLILDEWPGLARGFWSQPGTDQRLWLLPEAGRAAA